jgi:hypothetical protein
VLAKLGVVTVDFHLTALPSPWFKANPFPKIFNG